MTRILDDIEKHLRERRLLLERCAKEVGLNPEVFIDKAIPQSELFMAEVISRIHRLYLPQPININKTVLDVGPQTFGGTALLHRIHAKETFNKLKLEITAIDIVDKYKLIKEVLVPEIEFLLGNIYDIQDRVWDFTILSHVIEHVPNPLKFVRRCQELSRDFVLVACPYNEFPLETNGHINTIDRPMIKRMGGRDCEVYINYNWGKERDVCIFWLEGLAK